MNETTIRQLEKDPPHSLEAERAVLGSILLSQSNYERGRIWDICQDEHIVPEHFFDAHTREVYKTMQELSLASRPIDNATLVEALKVKNMLEAIGGVAFLQSLYDETPTTAHAEYYIKTLKEKYRRRRLLDAGAKTIDLAYDENKWPDAIASIGMAQKTILDLDDNDEIAIPWKDSVERSFREIDKMFSADGLEMEGLSTGIRSIDDILQGLKNSEMIVIGARPSLGKTSLAMNIAESVVLDRYTDGTPIDHGKQGKQGEQEKTEVLIFSLEMPEAQLSKRLIFSNARLDQWKLRHGKYKGTEKEAAVSRLYTTIVDIKDAGFNVVEGSGLDITTMRSIARRYKRKNNIKLVVIDYLTLCHYHETGIKFGQYQEVSMISRQIKCMAQELNVPVIVISQLSRSASNRGKNGEDVPDGYEEPKMSDLRESGAIEQDADVVILLHKTNKKLQPSEPEGAVVEIANIAKNRNGNTGKTEVLFAKNLVRFFDRAAPEPMTLA